MRKRRLKVILVALSILLLPLAFLLCEHVRGRISLARYKRELVAKGEKLTARELMTPPIAGENGAPDILEAIQHLKAGTILPRQYAPRMKLTPVGRGVVCFREAEWVEDKVTNHWDQLAADLATNESILSQIRVALERPVLNNSVDLSLGPKMTFPHLAPSKSLTIWFGAATQLALYEGRNQDALTNLIPQIQLPRLLADDRIVISQLVRIVIAAIARTDTWEALQAEGWSDDDLARIQWAWENQSFINPMVHSLEGETVFADLAYNLERQSNEEAAGLLYGLEAVFPVSDSERPFAARTLDKIPGGDAVADFLKKQVYCRLWRFAWLDQDERHYLQHMQALLALARSAAKQKSFAAIEPAIARLDEAFVNRNFYDKLRYPSPYSFFSLSSVVNKAMRAEAERSANICAIALKRYSLRHGKPPASLDSLVPEFVPSVPIDYMDGKPMKYHLNPDGTFTLYSVGADGKDDGSSTALLPDRTNRRDLWSRKDFVWPSPALPEEIETYREEAAKH